jgi:hypothetical protein
MIQIKTIGFFSFKTKRIYKTKSAKTNAESKFLKIIEQKSKSIIEKAKREIEMYRNYLNELSRTMPSFLRWSNIKECLTAIKEVRVSVPKRLRNFI